MNSPSPTTPFSNPVAPPDVTVLVLLLVTVVIALALDLYCMNYCLNDLNRRMIVTGGNKQLWAAIIIVGGPVGQAAYWLYGRGPY